ncbi:MAG: MFS transporter [Desulfovibrio sp.]|jgi:MFS family permease|nr:MFS transporter [Desulfovibrio sp.]
MSYPELAEDRKAQLIFTLKRRILPFAFLLYFFNMMDRINVGFAALTMNAELGITPEQYGTIASIFFLAYLIFQMPSNMILPKLGPKHWIGSLFVGWGLVTALTFFAGSPTYIFVTRFLIGMLEAGFFPGMIFYIACWFPQEERAHASGLFLVSAAISQLICAPISGWIVGNINFAGYAGWRWLFVIEGIPTIIVGISIFFFMCNTPSEAKWLSDEEKSWLLGVLEKEKTSHDKREKSRLRDVFFDLKLWQLALAYMFIQGACQAPAFWMPKQLQSLDPMLTNTMIGFIMMTPFVMGALAGGPWGRHSDRTGERKWHTAIPFLLCMVSFLGVAFISWLPLRVFFLGLYGAGIFAAYGPFFAAAPRLLPPAGLAVGIAFINTFSGIGALFTNKAIGYFESSYTTTHSLLFLAGLCLLAFLMVMITAIPREER